PLTGEGRDGTAVSAAAAGDRAPDAGGPDGRPDHSQTAGSARRDRGGRSALPGPSHLSVEVISPGTPPPAATGDPAPEPPPA
ncbi:hypothetical protein ACLQ2E_36150, partial [Streptomyces lavendulocolor]